MDKFRFKMMFILLFVLFPVLVYADDLNVQVSIRCPASVKANESVECVVYGNANKKVTDANLVFTLAENFTYEKFGNSYFAFSDGNNNWILPGAPTLDANTGTLDVDLNGEANSAVIAGSEFEFGKFKIKAGSGVTVGNSYNISVTAKIYFDDGDKAENVTNQASIAVAETPVQVAKGLETLRVVSGGSMLPAFDKNSGKYTWQIQLDSATTTKFKILAEPANVTDTVSARITGGADLDLRNEITFAPDDGGSMSITLTVGSGDNQVSYILIVTRPTPDNVGSPTLKSLTVGGTRVNLVSGQLDYTVTLDANTIKEFTIAAELSDSEHFKFKSTEVLSPHYLSGEQDIPITIVPKNDSDSYGSEIYIITVKSAGTTPQKEPEKPVSGNPNTGPGPAIIMGLLLVASFAASMYYYKKNINGYN